MWSLDGQEAGAYGALGEVRRAENGPEIALLSTDMGARVWLRPDEVSRLLDELTALRAGGDDQGAAT